MDEEVQSVETTEVAAPSTDNAPVEHEQTAPAEETAVDQSQESEDKRDFRGYAKNLEAKNKELRALYEEAQRSLQTQTPTATKTVDPQTPDEAMGILRNLIEESIAPLKEEKIWDTFEKQPMVSTLRPEIVAELTKLPQSMPLQERLETARKNAIVNNLDKIQAAYQEIGTEKAYNNQALKKGNTGLGQSRSKAGQQQDSVIDRVLRGETQSISMEEYRENRAEIQKAMREQVYGSS